MGTSNYSDEFKRDAVQQIRVRGYPVSAHVRNVARNSCGRYNSPSRSISLDIVALDIAMSAGEGKSRSLARNA